MNVSKEIKCDESNYKWNVSSIDNLGFPIATCATLNFLILYTSFHLIHNMSWVGTEKGTTQFGFVKGGNSFKFINDTNHVTLIVRFLGSNPYKNPIF